jgi:hypothetical protein
VSQSMSLLDITHESLSRQLDREVPEVYVIIAKHNVLGMDDDGIREIIGCSREELAEVLNDPLYREVRIFIGAAHGQEGVDQTTGWDKLEALALTNLKRRMELPSVDPEFALKVAAIANKASRRHTQGRDQGVLDPSAGRTAKISLTTRLVRSFNREGQETQTVEKQLSIHDGSMSNPSFDDVDTLLNVSATPALPRQLEVKTHTADVGFDDLDDAMKEKGF